MDSRSENLLGLDEVRARVAAICQTPQGAALAGGRDVAGDPDEVVMRQAVTTEATELRRLGMAVGAGAREIAEAVDNAQHGGALEIESLTAVAATAAVAVEVAEAVVTHEEEVPLLTDVARGVATVPLRALVDMFDAALDGHGGVRDSASPDLGRARRLVADARSAAAETLRSVAKRAGKHLQESFLTERGGRPVLAVKASSRSAVPGIVHDRSATGQTIFVEPLEVVEANNLVREREAAERMEVERVLQRLSGVVGDDAGLLTAAVAALADIDLAFALADLSLRWRGCEVTIGGDVALVGARHPLLDPGAVVPVDLPLTGLRVLVVSGPNAGGKTVGLKTLGVLAACHQMGLRPPATEARLPVFDTILADIGDEQSIERSLSTFSGHVRRLIDILSAAGPRSLVLLDELAAGTDPGEGAALAVAVLDTLMARGALTLVTTHHHELKGWASQSDAAANAAVGFDAEHLLPTFELRVGEPGASQALDVAERLGLPDAILSAARERLGQDRQGMEALLRDAAAARVAAEEERDRAYRERDEAAKARRDVEARERELARQVERVRASVEKERQRAREDAERDLAQMRADMDAFRKEISAARREERRRKARQETGRHEAERDRRLGAASEAAGRAAAHLSTPAPPPGTASDEPIDVGDAVIVSDLGVRGTVVAVSGDEVEVQGPSARLRLKRSRVAHDHRVVAKPSSAPVREVRPETPAVSGEIDVRGERAEAARAAVRSYIDLAASSGRDSVRIIHGRGTGALRAAIADELRAHPLVGSSRMAGPDEGGDGATVAELR